MAKLALLFLFLFLFLHYLFYNFLLNKPFTPGSSPFILSRLAFRETVTVSQTKMAHTLRRRKYLYSLYRGAFSPSPRVYARFKGAMSLGYNLQTGTKEKDSVCMCWWRGGGGEGEFIELLRFSKIIFLFKMHHWAVTSLDFYVL